MTQNDFIQKIRDGKGYREYLYTKTYHKTIRGFDMFVYRVANNNWVCTDTVTGACIDNILAGHKTKKTAFESAINFYSKYTDAQIRNAHKDALKKYRIPYHCINTYEKK